MNQATTDLLIELVIVPVIKTLAVRRGVHGVTEENLKQFTAKPEKVLALLKDNKGLCASVVEDLADSIDNVAGDAVDALTAVFAAFTPGGVEQDES